GLISLAVAARFEDALWSLLVGGLCGGAVYAVLMYRWVIKRVRLTAAPSEEEVHE
ncbi:MAG: hypothetical protein JWQ59_1049, partial [Cryobacterium sp.]|nr:hypothetical protein [Cryobacterium sp.]